MTTDASSQDTRTRILASAREIVDQHGPGALTLDSVARHAGLSKGGLLYHFPGKDALVQGMIEETLTRFEADVDRLSEHETAGPGRWLRAFVRLTFAALPEHDPGSSILAAAATNPDLLEPVGRYFARWQARACEEGLPERVVTMIRLASDGLWFADMFDASAPDGELRAQVLDELLAAIGDAEQSIGRRI